MTRHTRMRQVRKLPGKRNSEFPNMTIERAKSFYTFTGDLDPNFKWVRGTHWLDGIKYLGLSTAKPKVKFRRPEAMKYDKNNSYVDSGKFDNMVARYEGRFIVSAIKVRTGKQVIH